MGSCKTSHAARHRSPEISKIESAELGAKIKQKRVRIYIYKNVTASLSASGPKS
jgi:hypothetical protein